jgi:hypothetical protein
LGPTWTTVPMLDGQLAGDSLLCEAGEFAY